MLKKFRKTIIKVYFIFLVISLGFDFIKPFNSIQ
jgi:hypothetical protein